MAFFAAGLMGFGVATSCGPTAPLCNPSTCASGCCDANNECVAGTALFECGVGGAACTRCEANPVCSSGACALIDGGLYDASFRQEPDASFNADAGTFDGGGRDGGPGDAGRPDGGAVDAGPVSFTRDIAPVFDGVCNGCHVWNYTSIVNMTVGPCGVLVKPGNPTASAIYTKVAGTTSCGAPMPKDLPSLSQPTIDAIGRWIQQGAPNN